MALACAFSSETLVVGDCAHNIVLKKHSDNPRKIDPNVFRHSESICFAAGIFWSDRFFNWIILKLTLSNAPAKQVVAKPGWGRNLEKRARQKYPRGEAN